MSLRFVSPSIVGASLCCVASIAGASERSAPKRSYHFARGDAATTLRQFATITGSPVLFMMDKVQGEQTNAIDGEYSPSEALDLMLAGTSLEFVRANDGDGFLVERRRPATQRSVVGDTNPKTKKKNMAHWSIPTKLRAWLARAALAASTAAFAQEQPAKNIASATADEPIHLSPFVVNTGQVGRYQSTEATSGSRVATNVVDSPSSISVIPSELIQDVSPIRLLDVAKYASGVTESTIPSGLDRTTIRGFQQEGSTVDGFLTPTQQGNTDPILAERIEVVKGPNAVLAPSSGNAPGGTINVVSRKPQFRDFGDVSYQIGRYFGNRATLDVNRKLSDSWAFRVVGAYMDTKWYPSIPLKSTTLMPMVTWASNTGAQLTAQFQFTDFHNQNYLGLPIDPSVGSTGGYSKLWSIVPRTFVPSGDDYRSDRRKEIRLFLTAPLSESVNMRLAARFAQIHVGFAQNTVGFSLGSQSGGAINPLTGLYTPGFVYSGSPDFTPSAAPSIATTLSRNGSDNLAKGPLFNIQNDYVYHFKNALLDSTTVGGLALNYVKQYNLTINTTRPVLDFTNPTAPDFVRPSDITAPGALFARNNNLNVNEQAYATESVKLLSGKVILNGSYSYNNYDIQWKNLLTVAPTASVPIPQNTFAGDIDTQLKSYGVVVKPVESVSLYYGHSENTAVNVPSPASIIAGTASLSPLQEGKQNEYGVRWQSTDKRILVTLAHFDIKQSAFAIPNPANLIFPQPFPNIPFLITDRHAHGYELEVRASLTKNFSLIGNATTFKNRDPNNVPFRMTAEQSAALLANYQFDQRCSLHGLSVAIGVDYLGKRPGDGASGFTAASTPTHPIPNQPTFWHAPRTLLNVMASYSWESHWSAQLNVTNVLNKQYIDSSLSRALNVPGEPINPRLQVSYKF